jgi:hypothetical protein
MASFVRMATLAQSHRVQIREAYGTLRCSFLLLSITLQKSGYSDKQDMRKMNDWCPSNKRMGISPKTWRFFSVSSIILKVGNTSEGDNKYEK